MSIGRSRGGCSRGSNCRFLREEKPGEMHPRSAPPYRLARFSKKWKQHVNSCSIGRTCTDVMDDSRSDGTASFVSERLVTPDFECYNHEESLVDSSSKEAGNMREDETNELVHEMGTLEHDLDSDVVSLL